MIKPGLPRSPRAKVALTLVWLLALDLLSGVGWAYPRASAVAAVLLGLAWLIIAIRNLPLGVALLVTELVLGSFGYLFKLEVGETRLSLRFILFVLAFGLMLVRIARDRKHPAFTNPYRWWFVLGVAALMWSTAWGYVRWNEFSNMFLDLNGYLYLLLFPLFMDAAAEAKPEDWSRYFKWLVLPAVLWLTARTLLLLYLFTHFDATSLIAVYKWWRDTGLGEITPAGGGFWRVFSQAHIFSAIGSAVGFGWLWLRLKRRERICVNGGTVVLAVVLTALVASLSRSMWLGTAFAWLVLPLFFWNKADLKTWLAYLGLSALLVLTASGAVLFTSRVSWPVAPLGQAGAQAFASRFGSEPAGQARLKLLKPLYQHAIRHAVTGQGIGATVLYFSTDPRAVQSTAGGSGQVNTYAFEWGYLDLWLKFGAIGAVLYLAFLLRPYATGVSLWRRGAPAGLAAVGLTALFVTHMTTPYLNHPLGIGAVLAVAAYLSARPWQPKLTEEHS